MSEEITLDPNALGEQEERVRNMAHLEKIKWVKPIEGADRIELVGVLGWQCVTQKSNGFKEGDLVVYFEIDSLLPADNPEFEFLEGKPLKTRRFKGELSQGMVLPLGVLRQGDYYLGTNKEAEIEYLGYRGIDDELKAKYNCANYKDAYLSEGMDVTEILRVKKYEKPVSNSHTNKLKPLRWFPPFMRKTDEERIQNLGWVLDQFKGTECYVTEKLDGSSTTVYYKDGEVGVCSRNMELKRPADDELEENHFWNTAIKEQLVEKLTTYGHNIALQGELVGPGVQGNKYNLKENRIYIFNVWNIDEQRYYDFDEFETVCTYLQLRTVPIINKLFPLPSSESLDWIIKWADGLSHVGPQVQREGIVIRPLKEQEVKKLGRFSFKAVSNKWLEKYDK